MKGGFKRGQTNARVEESRCAQDPDDDKGGSCQYDEPEAAGAGDAEAVLVHAYHVVLCLVISCRSGLGSVHEP